MVISKFHHPIIPLNEVNMKALLGLLGRMALSLIFLAAAAGKAMDWSGSHQLLINSLCSWQGYVSQGEVQKFIDALLPLTPILLIVATVFEALGGLLVFFGVRVRFGATLLLLFLIPTTIIFHAFWIFHGSDQQLQMTMFMKNLSIIGGLFILLAYGGSGSKAKEE